MQKDLTKGGAMLYICDIKSKLCTIKVQVLITY